LLYARTARLGNAAIAHLSRAKLIDSGVWVARNNSANKMGKFNSGFAVKSTQASDNTIAISYTDRPSAVYTMAHRLLRSGGFLPPGTQPRRTLAPLSVAHPEIQLAAPAE
jgi:hypothetical protein